MKIVITGATGFVGRHLTVYIERLGYSVIPVSRKAYPRMYQVEDYSQSPSGDILIHLAEESDRAKVNLSTEIEILRSSNLVKTFTERFNQRIIYASSGVVYGNANELPCSTSIPVNATDKYSELKLKNEKIVLNSGGVVIRLSNLFGFGMSNNNVLADIINQIQSVAPIYIRDDKPICDFLHISNVVTAFGLLLENSYSGILNVGSGEGTSIKRIAEILLAATKQNSRKIIATQPSLKRSVNILDISETKRILGWNPNLSLNNQLGQLLSGGEN